MSSLFLKEILLTIHFFLYDLNKQLLVSKKTYWLEDDMSYPL